MNVIIKDFNPTDKCIDCPLMVSRDDDDCIVQSDEANEKVKTWEN